MTRLAVFTCLFFLVIYHGFGVNPGLCEEKCPLVVTEWSPNDWKECLRPLISVTYSSGCGIAIDISSIRMFLDDHLVTPTITESDSEIIVTYMATSDLQDDMNHFVRVFAKDVMGTEGEKTWSWLIPSGYGFVPDCP